YNKHNLVVTRIINTKISIYFGHYTNAYSEQETKKLLDRIYPLRKCNTMPDKLCLYYHIDQCLGPCVFNVTDEQNQEMIDGITNFLNGETDSVMAELKEKMENAAAELEFEK